MPKLRIEILASLAALLIAGPAFAQDTATRTMPVDLPDGSVAQVTYHGDVRPQVTVAIRPPQRPVVYDDWYFDDDDLDDLYFDRGPAFDRSWPRWKRVRPDALQPAVPIEPSAMLGGLPFVVAGPASRGAIYFYTLISTSSRGVACVKTVEWRSHGYRKEPEVTRTDTGDCGP